MQSCEETREKSRLCARTKTKSLCLCPADSAGASAWQRGCEQRPAGDEGGERQDGHGEESDDPGAVPLGVVPAAPPHRRHAAALPAAVGDQRCESDTPEADINQNPDGDQENNLRHIY